MDALLKKVENWFFKGIFVKEQMIDTQLAKRGTEIC